MNQIIKYILSVVSIVIIVTSYSCSSGTKKINGDKNHLPQVHFTHGDNWTGEPTGMLYYEGQYHVFYQHNPEQAQFGNIHWGHAVSSDLVDWVILPTALAPDSLGQIYSGSVIVDIDNVSGYGSNKFSPFIAYYTYCDTINKTYSLSMAYSQDKGVSWTKCNDLKISDKDVLNGLRSPNVSWDEVHKKWIMTVSTGSTLKIFNSSDCKEWTYSSEFRIDSYNEGGWENSSLFSLVAPDSEQIKWVLAISMRGGPADGAPAIRYFVGDFDGSKFKMTQNEELWIDYGKDCYGGMIFNNTLQEDKIMMNWMNCWYYAGLENAETWHGSMTIPRTLRLISERHYYIVASSPIEQLSNYSREMGQVKDIKGSKKNSIFSNISLSNKAFGIKLVFDNSNRYAIWSSKDYGVRFKTQSGKTLSIGYKADLGYYYIDRTQLGNDDPSGEYNKTVGAVYYPKEAAIDWYILYDRHSIELFACDGSVSLTSLCYTDEDFMSVELFSESGDITLIQATISELAKNKITH